MKKEVIKLVKCKVCGENFMRLRKHLRVKHDMTVRQYRNKFPNAPIVAEEYAQRARKITQMNQTNKNLIIKKKGE